jgi:hypothetical protein
VFASAKKTFFAGGDLNDLLAIETANERTFRHIEESKAVYRELERLPVPVVAAINGAVLGGGYPSEPMTMWPISTRVNKPENDEAAILEPVEAAGGPSLV